MSAGQDTLLLLVLVLVLSPSLVLLLWLLGSFCVEGRSWHGARSVGDEWAKTAGGTRRVGDSGETKSESRGRVAITARAIVLNKVFIIVVTCLEGEDAGVRVVRISGDSGEGVEPTHHPGRLDRVGIGGRKNSLQVVAVMVVSVAVGVGGAGRVVAVAATDAGDRGKDGDESSIGEAWSMGVAGYRLSMPFPNNIPTISAGT